MSLTEDKAFLDKVDTKYSVSRLSLFQSFIKNSMSLDDVIKLDQCYDLRRLSCLDPQKFNENLVSDLLNYSRVCHILWLSYSKGLNMKLMNRLLNPANMDETTSMGYLPDYLNTLQSVVENYPELLAEEFINSTAWRFVCGNHTETRNIFTRHILRYIQARRLDFTENQSEYLAWYNKDNWSYVLQLSNTIELDRESQTILLGIIDKQYVNSWRMEVEKRELLLVAQLPILNIVSSIPKYYCHMGLLLDIKKIFPKVKITGTNSFTWVMNVATELAKQNSYIGGRLSKYDTLSQERFILIMYDSWYKTNHSAFYEVNILNFVWLELILEDATEASYLTLGLSEDELNEIINNSEVSRKTKSLPLINKFWFYNFWKNFYFN